MPSCGGAPAGRQSRPRKLDQSRSGCAPPRGGIPTVADAPARARPGLRQRSFPRQLHACLASKRNGSAQASDRETSFPPFPTLSLAALALKALPYSLCHAVPWARRSTTCRLKANHRCPINLVCCFVLAVHTTSALVNCLMSPWPGIWRRLAALYTRLRHASLWYMAPSLPL